MMRRPTWGQPDDAILDYYVRETAGPFYFAVKEPGIYSIAAFQDSNRDLVYDPEEPGVPSSQATTFRVASGETREEIDLMIEGKLASGWTLSRLDRPMKAILRAGTYELIARRDVPVGAVISEYVDVAHAFYEKRESGFVNGLFDAIAKVARA